MPYLHLIDEAIELIKTEVRIVNLHIKYPEQFQQHANKLFLSPLQLADKTSLINIMEIVSGLFLSKRIVVECADSYACHCFGYADFCQAATN